MLDVVLVLLLELVVRHLATDVERLPPPHQRLLDRQTDALEEQAELKSRKVLEVLLLLASVPQVTHAWREVARREMIDLLGGHVLAVLAVGHVLGRGCPVQVRERQVDQDRQQTRVLVQTREVLCRYLRQSKR